MKVDTWVSIACNQRIPTNIAKYYALSINKTNQDKHKNSNPYGNTCFVLRGILILISFCFRTCHPSGLAVSIDSHRAIKREEGPGGSMLCYRLAVPHCTEVETEK